MTSRGMKAAVVSGAAALVLGLMTGMAGSAAAAAETCDGLTPTIVGTDGSDDLVGTSGDDVVSLGTGNDHLDGRGGNDVVCGGPGNDALIGGGGDDRIFGEDGNDIVVGGRGDDLVDGGDDNDTVYGDQLGGPQRAGLDGVDQMLGGPGTDRLELVAGDGFGAGGADVADGGPGVDTASYESSPIGVRVDVANGVAHGAADDRLTAFESYQGSEHNDTMLGSDGPDVLDALLGSGHGDHVVGRGGNDVLSAYNGRIDAGRGNDVYTGGDGAGHLVVELGKGSDRADISGGTATVRGGRGADTFHIIDPVEPEDRVAVRLHGGAGHDLLSFASLPHRMRVDIGRGLATGHKVRSPFRGIERVVGTAHDDVLVGSSRQDSLVGRAGNDLLRGRGAGDLLVGGTGRDTANGGRGHDRCAAEVRISCRRPG